MLEFIVKRLMLMIPMLFGITIITFAVIHLAPGNAAEVQMEMQYKASAQARENLQRLYGLDQPVHIQYFNWLKRFVRFDFGRSFVDDRLVTEKILERLPITLGINILSLMVVFLVALPIGILSAVYQNTPFDRGITVFVFIGYSTPSFWLALLLMIFFGVQLGWLPISGIQSVQTEGMSVIERIIDVARHLVLPVITAGFSELAGMSRYSRTSMLEVIRQDYIRTARAKGLRERTVIMRHGFRNALLPILTLVGFMVPGLIGGSVIFETIFAIPGMGKLFIDSTYSRDYPTIMGILVIGAVLTMLGNLAADVSYSLADPRIRVGGGRQ